MKKLPPSLVTSAGAALLAAGCYVPPSAYERAAWGPPPAYWQEQGRFAQAPGEDQGRSPAPLNDPGAAASSSGAPASAGPNASAAAPEPPLYSWDGGVVDGAPQGQVVAQEEPRGLEPAGRMHIIELYQQVLDERDALAREVETLRATLVETNIALETESKRRGELEARVQALEEAQRGALADNQAIGARLVTAQIRRLEAEKLLLETRLEIERAREREQAAALDAEARRAGAKPRASGAEREGGRP